MDRVEYNNCMKPYMSGAATQEERSHNMCIGAKICTGKANNTGDAEKLCQQAAIEKQSIGSGAEQVHVSRKKTGSVCRSDLQPIVTCMMSEIDFAGITGYSYLEMEIKKALSKCMCNKSKPVGGATKKTKGKDTLDELPQEVLEALAQLAGIFGEPKNK